MTLFVQDKTYKLWKHFMTFAYYSGADALKDLRQMHQKGQKVTKNSLKKLENVVFPDFYKELASVMQHDQTTVQSFQKSMDTIIIDQFVIMHLDHPGV